MTKFQVISDLHIEYKNDHTPRARDYITPVADVLVMAGDIGSLYKMTQLTEFIQDVCSMFKVVLYVPGNHEWYEIPDILPVSYQDLERRLEKLQEKIDNLFVLNKNSVLIGDTCFAGCTLWSEPLCQVPRFIVKIQDMNRAKYHQKHTEDLGYIKSMIKYCNTKKYKLVVITHYPPSYRCLDGTKRKKKFQSLYASNLDHIAIKENVDTWVCGHTHTNFDFLTEGGTRVVSNQKGKAQLIADDYSDKFTVEI